MANSKTLLFFTGSFPFGRQEAFIENEIGFLACAFERVIVLPQRRDGSVRPLPNNVLVRPLPEFKGLAKTVRILFRALSSTVFWGALREISNGAAPLYRARTLASYVGFARMYANFVLNEVLNEIDPSSDVYLYSYWMDRGALVTAFLRSELKVKKVVSRVHRFDVYAERNEDSYLPLRRYLLNHIDTVYCISDDAAHYLGCRYPGLSEYAVSRLGTTRTGKTLRTESISGNSFHIVSVSNVIAVKRVALIAQAVFEYARRVPETNVRWTHFGDGPLFADLTILVKELCAPNLQVDLRGGQLNSVVKRFYESTPIDLFVNLSESEGIPVSFMEAMSYEIPVMATLVGGVSEILDDTIGFLLPVNVTAAHAAELIASIAGDRDLLRSYAARAVQTWNERYSADRTYPLFCSELLSTPHARG